MQTHTRDKQSHSMMNECTTAHVNEASLHSVIVTSVNSSLVLDSLIPMRVTGELGCEPNHKITTHNLEVASGLNVSSATLFTVHTQYGGINVDPEKVVAAQDLPRPQTAKQLCSLLELDCLTHTIGILYPFLTSIVPPLYVLTKKGALFKLTPTCQDTFNHIKQIMTQAPVIAFSGFSKTLCI